MHHRLISSLTTGVFRSGPAAGTAPETTRRGALRAALAAAATAATAVAVTSERVDRAGTAGTTGAKAVRVFDGGRP